MKIHKFLLKFLFSLPLFLACEALQDDDPQPDQDPEDTENSAVSLLLDSTCVFNGPMPNSTDQVSLSYENDKVYMIKGTQRLVKIEPDTAVFTGYYIQVKGQDQYYCLNVDDGFIEIGADQEGFVEVTLCAYDANQVVLGCMDLNFEIQEPIDRIICDEAISEKTWNWKYTIFNNNLFDYPFFNPSEPRLVTGYCRTADGTIENEVLLEEEGWTNFIHLKMKGSDKSFTWSSNWYTKHWDILTTDCNKAGYDIDTIEQVFKGNYVFDPGSSLLDLKFEKQHPEEGKHTIYLSCNVMVITRVSEGTDGGDDAGYTMVFEKLDLE